MAETAAPPLPAGSLEPSLQLALLAVWRDSFCRRLLMGSAALHLLLALAFHLSPDETHYALYSVNPAWSYFDHPPLVGWLQWLFAHLPVVGGSDVAMRLLPMACWLMAAWLLPALTFVLYGSTMAPMDTDLPLLRGALLLWCLAPMAHLLGLALVPDTLLMPLVLVVMLLTWRLCDPVRVGHWQRWALLGLALGLAGLSKYTAVFIGLGAMLNALWLLIGLLRRGSYRPQAGWGRFVLQVLAASALLVIYLLWAAGLVDWVALRSHHWLRIGWLTLLLGGAMLVYLGAAWAAGLNLRQFLRR